MAHSRCSLLCRPVLLAAAVTADENELPNIDALIIKEFRLVLLYINRLPIKLRRSHVQSYPMRHATLNGSRSSVSDVPLRYSSTDSELAVSGMIRSGATKFCLELLTWQLMTSLSSVLLNTHVGTV